MDMQRLGRQGLGRQRLERQRPAGQSEGADRTLGPLQAMIVLVLAVVLLGWLYLLLVGVPEAFKSR